MNDVTVKILGQANGEPTPHDDEYVVTWNPHTRYGYCDITTTPDRAQARRFDSVSHALGEIRTVSKVEPTRPTDGRPNRPLSGLVLMMEKQQ